MGTFLTVTTVTPFSFSIEGVLVCKVESLPYVELEARWFCLAAEQKSSVLIRAGVNQSEKPERGVSLQSRDSREFGFVFGCEGNSTPWAHITLPLSVPSLSGYKAPTAFHSDVTTVAVPPSTFCLPCWASILPNSHANIPTFFSIFHFHCSHSAKYTRWTWPKTLWINETKKDLPDFVNGNQQRTWKRWENGWLFAQEGASRNKQRGSSCQWL